MKKAAIFLGLCLAFNVFSGKASAMGYGLGSQYNENNCPLDAIQFNNQYRQYDAYALTEDKNSILLTFDEGYENGYTAKILDVLKEKNVKAIFFITGDYAKKEKALVRRMIDEGHVIGNHGMKHAAFPKLTEKQAIEELLSLHAYVKDTYGYEMQYFRFPCGEYSDESLKIVQECGYKTVFWSFAYVDWLVDKQMSCQSAYDKIVSHAHGGAIFLLHSVSNTNCEILGDVIDDLRNKGYSM